MAIKALMYGWEFPPRISGGLGVACYAIVKELAKQGVDLTLILPQLASKETFEHVTMIGCDGLMNPTTEFEGVINIRRPNVCTRLQPYGNKGEFGYWLSDEVVREFLLLLDRMHLPEELKNLAKASIKTGGVKGGYEVNLLTEVFRYALVAGELACEIQHDVIHAHDWLTVLASLEARYHSNKPIVLHIHALETDRSGLWVDKRIFAIEKYGMEQADRIIAVSQYTKDNIVEHYGIDPEKISVVHNGIYYDDTDAPANKTKQHKTVLFLGRITHQKGPYFFIEIAKKVLAKNPDVQFVLAGGGDQMTSMIEKVAGMRLGQNIHFTGFLDADKVHDIYKLANVYVMPSVSEPFGLSALEALSHNVPAVISKQSGVAEVLHHTLVADFWDTDNMANKILALLNYPALGNTSLSYTHAELKSASWEKAAQKIVDVYKKVI